MRSVADGIFSEAGLTPLVYVANKSATVVVAGQMVALNAATQQVRVTSLEAAAGNFAKVAFGTSQANAETNAAIGVVINPQKSVLLNRPSEAHSHMAWVGDTGTVILNVIEGE